MLLTKPNPIQLLWVNLNPPNYSIIKITKMPLKYKWLKYSKIFKNDQNTPKLQNYQNNHETYKMTKIPLKPKKMTKISQNLKITKIPPKPKKWQKFPWNLKNDKNTLET